MRSALDRVGGIRMALDDYYRDFEENFWNVVGFWKLERGQSFAEPGNPSWEAFYRGSWSEALTILRWHREELENYHERLRQMGSFARRVRVVTLPLTRYLQWELHALKIRDETGGPTRIVDVDKVACFEGQGPLPEIYTMGTEVMYEANYDAHGVLESATKYTDPDLIIECRTQIESLYAQGEPIAQFFQREVEPLAPPASRERLVAGDYLKRHQRPRPIRS